MRGQDRRLSGKIPLNALLEEMFAHVRVNLKF
jgi:hypothetical protein